jgi:preprotein translocase subunit SecG
MLTIVAIIHVLVSVALIFIVLLQTGRGSEIGAAFGSGASQTLFGSSGTTGFMTKVTSAAVVIFMVTSLVLAYFYSHREYVARSHREYVARPPAGQSQQAAPTTAPLPVPEKAPLPAPEKAKP